MDCKASLIQNNEQNTELYCSYAFLDNYIIDNSGHLYIRYRALDGMNDVLIISCGLLIAQYNAALLSPGRDLVPGDECSYHKDCTQC